MLIDDFRCGPAGPIIATARRMARREVGHHRGGWYGAAHDASGYGPPHRSTLPRRPTPGVGNWVRTRAPDL